MASRIRVRLTLDVDRGRDAGQEFAQAVECA
jgi:hypothetical protein